MVAALAVAARCYLRGDSAPRSTAKQPASARIGNAWRPRAAGARLGGGGQSSASAQMKMYEYTASSPPASSIDQRLNAAMGRYPKEVPARLTPPGW